MGKRLFQVLDEMNQEDSDNGTKMVQISNHFLEANKVKQGAKVVVGVAGECLMDLMNDNRFVLLLMIDKKEYESRMK